VFCFSFSSECVTGFSAAQIIYVSRSFSSLFTTQFIGRAQTQTLWITATTFLYLSHVNQETFYPVSHTSEMLTKTYHNFVFKDNQGQGQHPCHPITINHTFLTHLHNVSTCSTTAAVALLSYDTPVWDKNSTEYWLTLYNILFTQLVSANYMTSDAATLLHDTSEGTRTNAGSLTVRSRHVIVIASRTVHTGSR